MELDRVERAVLEVERRLGADVTTRGCPEIGDDVKILGVRSGDALRLTVACAVVGRYVTSLEAAAGKNPVTHTGKLYNLLADIIAGRCPVC